MLERDPQPVTLIHHRDARPDGTHAGWQIGGSYEVSYDLELRPCACRSCAAPSTRSRTRGGGEMGRAWYERTWRASRNTRSDFIDVADWLVDSG